MCSLFLPQSICTWVLSVCRESVSGIQVRLICISFICLLNYHLSETFPGYCIQNYDPPLPFGIPHFPELPCLIFLYYIYYHLTYYFSCLIYCVCPH